MKKWCKLSLASLVIPTLGSIGLVTVGCNNNYTADFATNINEPILSTDLVVYGSTNDLESWINTFNNESLINKVSEVNTWLTKETQLNFNKVSSLTITLNSEKTGFSFHVQLKDNDQFTDGNSWTSPTINYAKAINTINEPTLLTSSDERKAYGKEATAQAWWNNLNNDIAKELESIWINSNENLTADKIGSIQIIPFNNDAKKFTFAITLINGYVFADASGNLIGQTWNSPQTSPIDYATLVNEPQKKSQNIEVTAKSTNAQEWWNNLNKNQQLDEINNWLISPLEVDINQINFEFIATGSNEFKIQLTLLPGFVFDNFTNQSEISAIKYNSSVPLSEPTPADPLSYFEINNGVLTGLTQEGKQKTSLSLPNNVTTISANVFKEYTNLISITIPGSVKDIDPNAFYNCTNLITVFFSEGSQLTTLPKNIFRGCKKLITISIPTSIQTIGDYAFYECSNLSTVNFSQDGNLTNIGIGSFWNCTALKNVVLPINIQNIDKWAFYNCQSLNSIAFPSGSKLQSIGEDAFTGESSEIKYYVFDQSIRDLLLKAKVDLLTINITDNGFIIEGTKLIGLLSSEKTKTSLKIPDYVTEIWDDVFKNYTNLKSIDIPTSVSYFGANIFEGCKSLQRVDLPNELTWIGNNTFKDCIALTNVTIPKGVIEIDDNVFLNCSSLNNVSLPPQLTNIGDHAFQNCSSLTSIDIPNTITVISEGTFSGCTNLKNVTIPSSITVIGNNAFNNCSSLEGIEIPSAVTWIGPNAFEGCNAFSTEKVINHSFIIFKWWVFHHPYSNNQTLSQIVNLDLANYTNSDNKQFTIVNDNAFLNDTSLQTLKISSTITNIGIGAFEGCKSLNNIDFGNKVSKIWASAFYDCSALKNIIIPSNVISIDSEAFYQCTSLQSLKIENGTEIIGWDVFNRCHNLKIIILPASVHYIGDHAFEECAQDAKYYVPNQAVTKLLSNSKSHIFDSQITTNPPPANFSNKHLLNLKQNANQ